MHDEIMMLPNYLMCPCFVPPLQVQALLSIVVVVVVVVSCAACMHTALISSPSPLTTTKKLVA
jgi:hypothetical protein